MKFVLRQYKALGVIFLALVVVSVYLTYATFTKKFADYDEVTVQTSKIGLQLPSRADVKIRGVLVGEVLATDADADGATLTLGLYPSQVDTIPANVTASIVPKTLFGEKYVSLIVPDQPSGDPIKAGATIKRTQVATEVEQVLSDLYPLLRTVSPGELNMTLNALATALEGRGDQIGQNLETIDAYLTKLNPQIPALIEDLKLTAEVSDTYADVLPQIGDILQNTVTTTTHAGDPRGEAQPAPQRRHPVLGDRPHLPRQQRRQPDPARRGQRGPAPGAGPLLHRVPVPARGHRDRRRAPGRGVPRLHAPHRAGDAAEPAPGLHPRRRPAHRRGPRPDLPAPAQRAVEPGQPGPAPARLRRRRRLAARQGHPARRCVVRTGPGRRVRRLRRLARGVRPARPAARPRARHQPRRRPRPRRPAGGTDGPRRDRVAR